MPNENDLDVLYSLINQSPDGYKEFYPQKEGETALDKWPFLAKISISGTNCPATPIQLRVSENIFTLPKLVEANPVEIKSYQESQLTNEETSDVPSEQFVDSTSQVSQDVFSKVPLDLEIEKNSTLIPSFLTKQVLIVKPEAINNNPQIVPVLLDTAPGNQNNQIISLFKRLEKN